MPVLLITLFGLLLLQVYNHCKTLLQVDQLVLYCIIIIAAYATADFVVLDRFAVCEDSEDIVGGNLVDIGTQTRIGHL